MAAATKDRRRTYLGVGGDHVPSLGVLEGDILRILWDAGKPQSSVEVYEAMFQLRRTEDREMQSPSTIAVTLSRMVEKGLLSVQRKSGTGKGYYNPTQTRAQVVSRVIDDVSRRLTGKPLSCILEKLGQANLGESIPGDDEKAQPVADDVIAELVKLAAAV
jgi:predicted transcriptional regulator